MWLRDLLRFSLAITLAIGFGSTLGCSASLVKILVPGFADGDVDGVWLWRRLASGSYERACRIDFSNVYTQGSVEIVDYQQFCFDGRFQTPLWNALVARSPGDPDSVTLVLKFGGNDVRLAHKASSFNAAGESGLSAATAQL
jgi:hypothetical protein